MSAPLRTKYLEERLGGDYFLFGVHTDGRVDIASDRHGTVVTASKEHAMTLCEDRHELMQVIRRLATDLHRVSPETYDRFYSDLVSTENRL